MLKQEVFQNVQCMNTRFVHCIKVYQSNLQGVKFLLLTVDFLKKALVLKVFRQTCTPENEAFFFISTPFETAPESPKNQSGRDDFKKHGKNLQKPLDRSLGERVILPAEPFSATGR